MMYKRLCCNGNGNGNGNEKLQSFSVNRDLYIGALSR